jgi:hypothetical protein
LLADQLQGETTLKRLFEPSKGVTPSFGTRTSTIEDSENRLYVLELKGDLATFLGRQKYEVIRKAVVKIGLAKEPRVRCDTHNAHLPPACAFSWRVAATSKPFPGAVQAKEAEDRLKNVFKDSFESLGGEFFLVDQRALLAEFAKVSPADFEIKPARSKRSS